MEADAWEQFLPTVLDSLPALNVLDDRCRCSICKDYLQGPMMTSCGHTFCSLCIRRALNSDGRCPLCRSLEEESKLRKNLKIEEIVEAFLPFRTNLMQYNGSRSPRTSRKIATAARKNSEISLVDESDIAEIDETRPTQSTARSGRVTRASTNRRQASSQDSNQAALQPGHVACPICQRAIHQDKVESHVNRCLEGRATPPTPQLAEPHTRTGSRSQYFGNPSTPQAPTKGQTELSRPIGTAEDMSLSLKRLPKMSYAAMNDAKLRKTMADLGISTLGSRTQLQRRCTEFITMWNSNLDSKVPRSKRELLSDMRAWDRVQAKPVIKVTNEEIDSAHETGQYDSEFGDLIAKARESLKKRKAAEAKESTDTIANDDRERESDDQHDMKRRHTAVHEETE